MGGRGCKTCRGTGEFRWYADGPGTEIVNWVCSSDDPSAGGVSCVEQFQLHRYLLHAGIGMSYQRLGWQDAGGVPAEALGRALDYVDRSDHLIPAGIGLTLLGSPGTGKTLLATLLLKDLLARGRRGYLITFHSLLDAFTEGWTSPEDKAWFDHRIRHAEVLVIDDIGREYKGRLDVAISTLDHVLRARVANERPTVLTSNLTIEEIAGLYTRNALDLLVESAEVIDFAGMSYREDHRTSKVAEAKQGLSRPIVVG